MHMKVVDQLKTQDTLEGTTRPCGRRQPTNKPRRQIGATTQRREHQRAPRTQGLLEGPLRPPWRDRWSNSSRRCQLRTKPANMLPGAKRSGPKLDRTRPPGRTLEGWPRATYQGPYKCHITTVTSTLRRSRCLAVSHRVCTQPLTHPHTRATRVRGQRWDGVQARAYRVSAPTKL
jgi:hypothetical protein